MGRSRSLVGVVLAALLVLTVVGCDGGSVTTSTANSSGEPEEIPWERVVELVREGRVEAVSQYHSLLVQIRLVDGREYQATEPQIDAIFSIVEEAPNRDSIVLATE